MKYYIPTSSLNLDNILQAESISPSSFYSMRITGYKTIEVLNEFKGINKLVLFQHPIRFTINDPNRYNYPLLIEVEDENQLALNKLCKESEGVYSISNTIYLTPTNCRFFFYSENDYKLTTINTKNNKTIKYFIDYQIFSTTDKLQLRDMPNLHVKNESRIPESHEKEMDKRKGLLYAFLLGQTLSVNPELAHKNKLTQEIYDNITGILATFSKSEELQNKLYDLLEDYRIVDEFERKFNNLLDLELGRFKSLKSVFIKLLKKWGVWDVIFRKLSIDWGIKTLPVKSELITRDNFNSLRDEIEKRTESSLDNFRRTKEFRSFDFIRLDNKITIEGLPILSIAVNYIIKNNLIPEQLFAHRTEICLGMINELKDYYIAEHGEKAWVEAPRPYFNNLYAHIRNIGVAFNIKAIDNLEMSAIAAFLLKGHSIDGFLVYLKMNEFSDYTSPLIFWGALSGYMEMNREVLPKNILTIDYYKDVYYYLHGEKMFKAIWEYGKVIEDSNATAAEPEDSQTWKQGILKYAKEKAIKKDKNKLASSLEKALDEIGNSKDYYELLKLLLEYDGWKGPSKAWKRLQEHFAPNYNYKKKDRRYSIKNGLIKNEKQNSLFD